MIVEQLIISSRSQSDRGGWGKGMGAGVRLYGLKGEERKWGKKNDKKISAWKDIFIALSQGRGGRGHGQNEPLGTTEGTEDFGLGARKGQRRATHNHKGQQSTSLGKGGMWDGKTLRPRIRK